MIKYMLLMKFLCEMVDQYQLHSSLISLHCFTLPRVLEHYYSTKLVKSFVKVHKVKYEEAA